MGKMTNEEMVRLFNANANALLANKLEAIPHDARFMAWERAKAYHLARAATPVVNVTVLRV